MHHHQHLQYTPRSSVGLHTGVHGLAPTWHAMSACQQVTSTSVLNASLRSDARHASQVRVHETSKAHQRDVRAAVFAEPRLSDALSWQRSSRPLVQQTHAGHPHIPHTSSHPVLQVIHQRLQDGNSSPGRRRDNLKLGLVVEGGGMRGIVTGAMLMGLQDMGLFSNVFDAVYGASAGAINATYFLTAQPEGLDIYQDHLAAGSRFLSLKRYWSSNPVMDLSYLIDDVMQEIVPLNWDGVINSELPLKVVASSLTTLRSEIFTDFVDRRDLAECLKASANVPEIVGGPRQWRGHSLVDAAVFEPLPVKAALRDGCTHVLALCSRPHKLGPAWGKYIDNVLGNAIKYWLMSPPYMREAWRVEPLHSTHRGQPLDDLLVQMLMHGHALELDAALDNCSATPSSSMSSSRGSSADSSMDDAHLDSHVVPGSAAVAAAEGMLTGQPGYVYPVYPGPAAVFAPICTDVETLQMGRQEGYRSVHRLMAAITALQQQTLSAASLQ